MKENIILVHGHTTKQKANNLSKSLNEIGWFGWLKDKLIQKGHLVENPLVPSLWNADYKKWKETFEKCSFNKDTIIIATSAGVAFIVRFLGEKQVKIGKLILVAPAKFTKEKNILTQFYDFEIDKTLQKRIGRVDIFISRDDEKRHQRAAQLYHEKLGGNIKVFLGKKHFVVDKLEEILEVIFYLKKEVLIDGVSLEN